MMRLFAALLFSLLPTLGEESKPQVKLQTSLGDIVIELDPVHAPLSSENFLNYTRAGFYDGTVFHRVMSNFMIQGGGFAYESGRIIQKPTADPIRNESQNGLSNLRGTIAMARTSELHSATSQFFINVEDNDGSRGPTAPPSLDYPSNGGYAVFGRVIEGMDVVDRIREVPTGMQPLVMRHPLNGKLLPSRAPNVPLEPVIIHAAIHLNPTGNEPDVRPSNSDAVALPLLLMGPLLAFLLGSIPFGLMIARSQGVDIREHGSGNIGATNVWRTLGKKFGIPCLILDLLKGLIPVLLVVNLLQISGRGIQFPLPLPEAWVVTFPAAEALTAQTLHILTALLAVLGHNYSPWVRFRGGKGIATSAGVLLGLMPFGLLILLAVWLLLFFTTRYVSIASVVASLSLPLVTLWGSWHHGRIQDGTWNQPLFVFALLIAVLATWKHRGNISRLLQGTESRFTRK